MVNEQSFLDWLRQFIKDRELLPTQLSRAIGVSHPTVLRWLSTEDVPSPASVRKLADYAGVPLEKLMGLVGHLPPQDQRTDGDSLPPFREYMALKYPDTDAGFVDAVARSLYRQEGR